MKFKKTEIITKERELTLDTDKIIMNVHDCILEDIQEGVVEEVIGQMTNDEFDELDGTDFLNEVIDSICLMVIKELSKTLDSH